MAAQISTRTLYSTTPPTLLCCSPFPPTFYGNPTRIAPCTRTHGTLCIAMSPPPNSTTKDSPTQYSQRRRCILVAVWCATRCRMHPPSHVATFVGVRTTLWCVFPLPMSIVRVYCSHSLFPICAASMLLLPAANFLLFYATGPEFYVVWYSLRCLSRAYCCVLILFLYPLALHSVSYATTASYTPSPSRILRYRRIVSPTLRHLWKNSLENNYLLIPTLLYLLRCTFLAVPRRFGSTGCTLGSLCSTVRTFLCAPYLEPIPHHRTSCLYNPAPFPSAHLRMLLVAPPTPFHPPLLCTLQWLFHPCFLSSPVLPTHSTC
uniref:Pecanex-like protein 1 n=1 Tax=Lygus hesperus TaxID=30085 RepID=A0A0A9WTT6_LYGHE